MSGHFSCFDYAYDNRCPTRVFRLNDGEYDDEKLGHFTEEESSDNEWYSDESSDEE
jgi:hypothetical protein